MEARAICGCPFKGTVLLTFNLLRIQTEACKYTHDNPNRHNDIRLIVENIIQGERKPSADGKQFAPAEPPLPPQPKASRDVHGAQELRWSVDRLHKYQNQHINEPEVQTIQTPTSSVSSAREHIDALSRNGDAHAVEAAGLPNHILNKVNLIGGVQVLKDLRDTVIRLRARAGQKLLTSNHEQHALSTRSPPDTPPLFQLAQVLPHLRQELEATELGELLCRFRKRIALSRFYDFYAKAQDNPYTFLSRKSPITRKNGRQSPNNLIREQNPRLATLVQSRIVDLMFSTTVLTNEGVITAGQKVQWTQKEVERKAAVRKVQDWRRNGKPWSAMTRRFGTAVLLLLPRGLSDEK